LEQRRRTAKNVLQQKHELADQMLELQITKRWNGAVSDRVRITCFKQLEGTACLAHVSWRPCVVACVRLRLRAFVCVCVFTRVPFVFVCGVCASSCVRVCVHVSVCVCARALPIHTPRQDTAKDGAAGANTNKRRKSRKVVTRNNRKPQTGANNVDDEFDFEELFSSNFYSAS
jgi:hypothetical protein